MPQNITATEAEFDSFETHHLLKTMRKKQGDSIHFTDGCGHLFEGIILDIKPNVKVKHQLLHREEHSNPVLTLGVGFIRHNRLDFMIEKVTELGVNSIYLFQSRHANFFTSNCTRWDKIARQAIKQSQRLFLPDIHPVSDFSKFLNQVSSHKTKYILDQNADSVLSETIFSRKSTSNTTVCIVGPEGGFSDNEIAEALDHGCMKTSLSKYRLRTETAAIAAVSALSFSNN